jgi:putative tricarboxylic transport membrane protein
MTALRRAAAPALGLAACVALLLHAGSLDEFARAGQLGPAFWPRLALIGLGLACLAQLVVGTRAPVSAPTSADPQPELDRRRLAAAVTLLVLYVLLTPWVGFPLATAGFILAFMRLSGARSWAGTLASAAVGTAGLLLLFVKLVYLPLPKGDGAFEAITLALYRGLRIF